MVVHLNHKGKASVPEKCQNVTLILKKMSFRHQWANVSRNAIPGNTLETRNRVSGYRVVPGIAFRDTTNPSSISMVGWLERVHGKYLHFFVLLIAVPGPEARGLGQQ